jgi:protein-L-isoaspartate(D-aspartate) O-methyltransferase
VTVELGNGAQGWSKGAPFDVIVVSGSLPVLPEALLQQLNVGGRLAVIIGQAPAMKAQLITRTGEAGYDTRTLFETSVKPLQLATAAPAFVF